MRRACCPARQATHPAFSTQVCSCLIHLRPRPGDAAGIGVGARAQQPQQGGGTQWVKHMPRACTAEGAAHPRLSTVSAVQSACPGGLGDGEGSRSHSSWSSSAASATLTFPGAPPPAPREGTWAREWTPVPGHVLGHRGGGSSLPSVSSQLCAPQGEELPASFGLYFGVRGFCRSLLGCSCEH